MECYGNVIRFLRFFFSTFTSEKKRALILDNRTYVYVHISAVYIVDLYSWTLIPSTDDPRKVTSKKEPPVTSRMLDKALFFFYPCVDPMRTFVCRSSGVNSIDFAAILGKKVIQGRTKFLFI